MKLISTRVHGVLDYLSVVLMLGLPWLLGWGVRPMFLLMLLAIGTLIYSLITRYELGVTRLLPMRAHLALDFLAGAFLLIVALMWTEQPDTVRTVLGVLGVFEIGAALLTDPEPAGLATEARRAGGTRARGT